MNRTLVFFCLVIFGTFASGCRDYFDDDDSAGDDDDLSADDDDTSLGDDDTSLDDDDSGLDDDDSGLDDDDATEEPLDCSEDNFEDNDSLKAATPVMATTYSGLRICDDDDDFYAFEASVGQQVSVLITFLQEEGDIDATLTGPDGSVLVTGTSISDNEEMGPTPITLDGTHTLEVRLYGDLGSATGNDYDLQIILETATGDDDDSSGDDDTVGDDDDTIGDDDDSVTTCTGPATIQPTVTLTNASGPGATSMSMDDPITVSVQLDHLSGGSWSHLYMGHSASDPCLFRILVIHADFPSNNQIIWSCGNGITFSTVTLSCDVPTWPVDTYLLEPHGYSYPLASGYYTVQVDLDPSCDHISDPTCSVTGLPLMQYSIVVREGNKTDEVADLDPLMAGIGECEDGIDNDSDGQTDCDDPDCNGKDICSPESLCSDGIDNDSNGATDCDDPGCSGVGGCP